MKNQFLLSLIVGVSASTFGCAPELAEQPEAPAAEMEAAAQMPTPKADRATVDPEEVTSEGSGEHGVEEANQQDRALHRSLSAAAWAAQLRFPQGAQNFLHFLENTGDALEMEVDRLLADNPVENIGETSTRLEGRINAQLAAAKAQADAWIEENGEGEFAFERSYSGEWVQFYASEGDWYWALGGFKLRIDAEIAYTPEGPVTITYRVEIEDEYNWDAGKEIQLPFDITITDEIFQRLHIVGIAREFSIGGTSSEFVYEYDYPRDTTTAE